MVVMHRGYKAIFFLALSSLGMNTNAASVPFGEYPNSRFPQDKFPMEGFPALERPDIGHATNYGFGLSMQDTDDSDKSSEDHEDNEHENDFPHGFKDMFGKSEHDGEERHSHAHLNPNFPHDKFPFDKFPKGDFPSDHYPDKFDNYPYPWGEYGVSSVPAPAAVWLFGSGLIGLVSIARRKSKSN